MSQAFPFRLAVVSLCLLLGACSDYQFKFNDRPVYTPAPLFTDYRIDDPALRECVRQTIKDQRATQAEDLTTLVCTNAGIISLEGIEAFKYIQQLNLAHNAIADVQRLTELTHLRRLSLADNAVENPAGLMTLAQLQKLDLQGNSGLDCVKAAELLANTEAKVVLPEHCDAKAE